MLKNLKTWWNRVWTTIKGWKTMIVSAVLALVGVLQSADWATIVSPQHVGPISTGWRWAMRSHRLAKAAWIACWSCS